MLPSIIPRHLIKTLALNFFFYIFACHWSAPRYVTLTYYMYPLPLRCRLLIPKTKNKIQRAHFYKLGTVTWNQKKKFAWRKTKN